MRGNSAGLTAALRDLFGAYVVEDEPRPANYSLRFSDDPKIFHTLYRGACVAVASPDPSRVVTALIRHLDAHGGPPLGLVPVQALAFIRDGLVTLVPMLWEEEVRVFARRLERDGLHLLDTHTVHLDPTSREVVVETSLRLDPASVERAIRSAPKPRRTDRPVGEGRYPLKSWLFIEFWQPPGPYSRATAARRAALLVRGGLAAVGDAPLDHLASLFESVRAEGVDPSGRGEIEALIRKFA